MNRALPAIAAARSAADLEAVRALFREYAEGVAEPCCFASFEQELAGLPGEYAPPAGTLLLARATDGTAAGCVALRPLGPGAAEMKRLYVRSGFRGSGLGRALAVEVIAAARGAGRTTLYLDTLPKMREAIALYRGLGFAERGPYCADPTPGAIFFELSL
jgi:ribosomal protein S18 acetylase RimI-like enzyme